MKKFTLILFVLAFCIYIYHTKPELANKIINNDVNESFENLDLNLEQDYIINLPFKASNNTNNISNIEYDNKYWNIDNNNYGLLDNSFINKKYSEMITNKELGNNIIDKDYINFKDTGLSKSNNNNNNTTKMYKQMPINKQVKNGINEIKNTQVLSNNIQNYDTDQNYDQKNEDDEDNDDEYPYKKYIYKNNKYKLFGLASNKYYNIYYIIYEREMNKENNIHNNKLYEYILIKKIKNTINVIQVFQPRNKISMGEYINLYSGPYELSYILISPLTKKNI